MSISTFERNGIIDLLSKKEGVFHLPRCPRIIHRGHAWIWFAMYVPVHDFSFFIQMAVVGEDGISPFPENRIFKLEAEVNDTSPIFIRVVIVGGEICPIRSEDYRAPALYILGQKIVFTIHPEPGDGVYRDPDSDAVHSDVLIGDPEFVQI